jgi:hypothetical protein
MFSGPLDLTVQEAKNADPITWTLQTGPPFPPAKINNHEATAKHLSVIIDLKKARMDELP